MADEIQIAEPAAEEIKTAELAEFEQALKDRAKELSDKNGGRKVIPLWYLDINHPEAKPIIGFLLEPNRSTKGSIMDTFKVSESRAQKIALDASLMKDIPEYDTRIDTTDFHYDYVNMAAGIEALTFVRMAISQFGKKK